MDMEKMAKARNWDGSTIQVKMKVKDVHEWAVWDRYNRKNQIHPTQEIFTEAEFLPEHLHPSGLTAE